MAYTDFLLWKGNRREPGNTESEKVFAVPSGKGERSILCHVVSKDVGLLEGCMLLFRGSKSSKSSDYHTEMNWNVFSHWCESKLFPSLKKREENLCLY